MRFGRIPSKVLISSGWKTGLRGIGWQLWEHTWGACDSRSPARQCVLYLLLVLTARTLLWNRCPDRFNVVKLRDNQPVTLHFHSAQLQARSSFCVSVRWTTVSCKQSNTLLGFIIIIIIITRVNPDLSWDRLISRVSGVEHGHHDLWTFWIHSDRGHLQARANHTGWGYLWSPS